MTSPIRVLAIVAFLAASSQAAVAQRARDTTMKALPPSAVRVGLINTPARVPKRWRFGMTASTGILADVSGRRYRIPLTDRVGTWRIDSVVPLAVATRADTVYLLADVSGRSASREDHNLYCGAGTEGDLLWVRLVHGRVVTIRTAPYTSCLRSLNEGDDAYARDRDSLWLDGTMGRGSREVSIRYWFHTPERGLVALVDTASADSLPRYPRALAFANAEGEVTARLEQVRGARQDTVRIVRASHPRFTEAVLTAISGWRMRESSDTSSNPITVHVRFALRADAACRSAVTSLAPWTRPPGYRATLRPRTEARDVQVLVEACATVTLRKEVLH